MINMNRQTKIRQNLQDAGCDQQFIQSFLQQPTGGPGQMRLLYQYRSTLLAQLHKYQREIECLDFLVYSLKKQHL